MLLSTPPRRHEAVSSVMIFRLCEQHGEHYQPESSRLFTRRFDSVARLCALQCTATSHEHGAAAFHLYCAATVGRACECARSLQIAEASERRRWQRGSLGAGAQHSKRELRSPPGSPAPKVLSLRIFVSGRPRNLGLNCEGADLLVRFRSDMDCCRLGQTPAEAHRYL